MKDAAENPALLAAQEAQKQVDICLDSGCSFRLEAGAGAGKTYSLVQALKRLIAERGEALSKAGQKVACITFTEVGRDEIAQEIEEHPAILVSTIHAFCWGFLGRFQKPLRALVEQMADRKEKIDKGGGVNSKPVDYNRGFFGVDDTKITLAHDDVPVLMAKLLGEKKFQRLLKQQFPVLFIDEYQDTDAAFMQSITDNFLKTGQGPLVGLFGDHWQTIYRKEYNLTQYPVKEIGKGSNFRSVPAIVEVLNKLRPELPQAFKDPDAKGEARFFHTNSWVGVRTNETHSKGDLPFEEAKAVRVKLLEQLQQEGWDVEKTKVLMLTHPAIAAEQGYPRIAEIFPGRSELFAKKEHPTIELLLNTVEPMCQAYEESRYGDMFRAFGARPAISKHADKLAWRKDMDELQRLRGEGTIGEVIDHLKSVHRPPLSDQVRRREEELEALNGSPIPESSHTLRQHSDLRKVAYSEVPELLKFVEKQTSFATQHSVKGAEFENVLVVLGGGWNHYNWPQLFELISSKALDNKNAKGFYRARNLFYVSISRPMARLCVIATQQLSAAGLATVRQLFGTENVFEIECPKLGQPPV